MLKQVGCRDIAVKLFDYNLLQFDELTPEHVEAFLTMVLDETCCDIILAAAIATDDAGRKIGRAPVDLY